MAYKSDIKKAITSNTRYIALKVYKPEYHEYSLGRSIITIEVEVRKKKRNELQKETGPMAKINTFIAPQAPDETIQEYVRRYNSRVSEINSQLTDEYHHLYYLPNFT
jgi:hypothetical protein